MATLYNLKNLNLSFGTHSVKVKAKAAGYGDSNYSSAILVYSVAVSNSTGYDFSYDPAEFIGPGEEEEVEFELTGTGYRLTLIDAVNCDVEITGTDTAVIKNATGPVSVEFGAEEMSYDCTVNITPLDIDPDFDVQITTSPEHIAPHGDVTIQITSTVDFKYSFPLASAITVTGGTKGQWTVGDDNTWARLTVTNVQSDVSVTIPMNYVEYSVTTVGVPVGSVEGSDPQNVHYGDSVLLTLEALDESVATLPQSTNGITVSGALKGTYNPSAGTLVLNAISGDVTVTVNMELVSALRTPSLSSVGNNLVITDNDGSAQLYDIYVDDTLRANDVPKTS